ncbi:hypothetical protein DCS_04963 [Drechmeria coniospora]|uniref:Zn(2)-C6 fungal-type domain-containing protein n=1 Tax=Drechmeria coniospora TaxID=98403 RepID=A0A151GLH4_DRECN|nr:hypothetical protein DCS_04963 [Drechmeria coniospora]KYK57950.1 hypothetical protein DCS_04963 [Drechmeria coniospora]
MDPTGVDVNSLYGIHPASTTALTAHSGTGTGTSTGSGSVSHDAATAPAGLKTDAPPIKRRAPIACRRCRRMRSKCVHDNATPPCKSCNDAGLPAKAWYVLPCPSCSYLLPSTPYRPRLPLSRRLAPSSTWLPARSHAPSEFPVRGQPDADRDYRHPRARADRSRSAVKARRGDSDSSAGGLHPCSPADDWRNLPPLDDLIDGVNRFTRHYFQLGFVPKQQFPERLGTDHRSVSLFLLLSILSISARLTPSLITRYGTGVKAAEFFMDRASDVALVELYQEPTLERCQAFYLLSIAQQGSAMRNKSYKINMGIAVRMAVLMHLHREETYQLQNPTPDLIIRAESARRTMVRAPPSSPLSPLPSPLSPPHLSPPYLSPPHLSPPHPSPPHRSPPPLSPLPFSSPLSSPPFSSPPLSFPPLSSSFLSSSLLSFFLLSSSLLSSSLLSSSLPSSPPPLSLGDCYEPTGTQWMLHSQDSLHSGPLSPVSLAAADLTTLLPCNEDDFAHGREPRSRAALDGTPPAVDNPSLMRDPNRSLFATLMQIHHFWGIVGRRAVSYSRSARPWEPTSEFSKMAASLEDWERHLPHEHLWSHFLLKRYKADGQDLVRAGPAPPPPPVDTPTPTDEHAQAYLCVTMMTRLCNIVLRRPYLMDVIKPDRRDGSKQAFFASLSKQLFRDVRQLYEQVDAQFTDRTPDESVGAQIAAFCVYSCGLFSTYICKYPHICQDDALARSGPVMLQRVITILRECKEVWPLAARWVEALEKSSLDPQSEAPAEGSMDDGRDPVPRAIRQLPPLSAATLPDNAVLPKPGTQPRRQATTQAGLLTPTTMQSPSDVLVSLSGGDPVLTPNQQQQYHHQLPLPPVGVSSSYRRQSLDQPAPHAVYMPQGGPLNRADGLGMMMGGFDSHPPLPYTTAYYPQLGPGNDGFEGELQFYITGAPSSWETAGVWADCLQ